MNYFTLNKTSINIYLKEIQERLKTEVNPYYIKYLERDLGNLKAIKHLFEQD